MRALISVTGPIAAGATTLCKRLEEIMGWKTALEADVEQHNPFFAAYGREPRQYAFHNQVTFMTQSAEAHQELRREHSEEIILQDFTPFEHTGVYASVQAQQRLLTDEELGIIHRLSSILEALYVAPTVLVYRPVSQEELRARVQERARPSERNLAPDFIHAVSDRFEEWVRDWARSPVIRLPPELDIKATDEIVRRIGDQILALT